MLARIRDKMDETVNPVLLRDLRLYGRGRGLLGAYFLTLTILVIAGVTYALAARWGGMDGAGLLYIPTTLIAIIVGALVPNLAGERFRSELSGRSSELALASPLTPGRMVRGKLYGAWILAAAVIATAAPVFATAYLLGGVTAGGLLGIAAGLLFAGLVMPLPQLYLATKARKPGGGRILSAVTFVANIALMYGYAALLYYGFAGLRASSSAESLFTLCVLAAIGGLYAQFLYFVTVGRLRPAALDRELRPRLGLAFGAAAGGAAGWALMRAPLFAGIFPRSWTGSGGFVFTLTAVAFAFCTGMEIISHDNGAEPPRARGDRRGFLSRALFSAGPGSLSLYFLLCGAAVLACGFLLILTADRLSGDLVRAAPVLLAPFVAYATGLAGYSWIVRPLTKKHYAATALPTAVTVINVVVCLIAAFALVLVNELGDDGVLGALVYGSNVLGLLFAASRPTQEIEGIAAVAGILLAVLAAAQIPVIIRGIRNTGARDR